MPSGERLQKDFAFSCELLSAPIRLIVCVWAANGPARTCWISLKSRIIVIIVAARLASGLWCWRA